MLLQCLPSSFSSFWLIVWEEMLSEHFRAGRHGGHLGYQNSMILTILNFHVAPMPPGTKFVHNLTWGLGSVVVSRFLRWLPKRPSWILEQNDFSNSEFYVAPMLPIKFLLNPSYGLGGYVIWRISSWPPWQPSWISELNAFSNSESLCCSDASHQVYMSLEEYRDGPHGGHLGYWNRMILVILNLYVNASHQVSAQSNSWFGRCRLMTFKMATMAAILDIQT